MTYITAQKAREAVVAPFTIEDLEAKYATVTGLVERRSRQRFYTVDVTVGDRDILEFKQFLKTQGFNAWTETTSPTPLPNAVSEIFGTERTVRVSWQNYTANLAITPGLTPPQIALTISTEGVTDEPTLYWLNTGTIDGSTAFATEVNAGNIQLDSQGTATLLLDFKTTPVTGGTVKIVLRRAQAEPTNLAETVTLTF
jgi:hypothetical protein